MSLLLPALRLAMPVLRLWLGNVARHVRARPGIRGRGLRHGSAHPHFLRHGHRARFVADHRPPSAEALKGLRGKARGGRRGTNASPLSGLSLRLELELQSNLITLSWLE